VGKRSGSGVVTHKAMLVNALSRALADRLMLLDFTIGRKGFLGYIKALAGSNIVKVVPASVDASGVQVNGHKRLKVVCGSNTSYLDDLAWIGDKTPMTLADVRVSPDNAVKPNIGSLELSEALNRVLPFTAKDDNRPVLACVNFVAKEGKLLMVSADGFRLAVVTLVYDEGEGQALVSREDLRGIANALRKAKRVRLGFEKSGDSLDGMSLIIDTEAIRYKWRGADGQFPDYEKLIPTEFNTVAHLDTVEADIEGKPVKVRIDGSYLAQALKACGGMVDFKVTNAYSPMLFIADGYQLVVMPMMTNEASEQAKAGREAKQAEAVTQAEAVAEVHEAESTTEAEPEAEKPKRKRKVKEPVAVA
jgi:DNA polymerase-3 subunit beta